MGPFKFLGAVFASTSEVVQSSTAAFNQLATTANIGAATLRVEATKQLVESSSELIKQINSLSAEEKESLNKYLGNELGIKL